MMKRKEALDIAVIAATLGGALLFALSGKIETAQIFLTIGSVYGTGAAIREREDFIVGILDRFFRP